jgi:hypothetical protein
MRDPDEGEKSALPANEEDLKKLEEDVTSLVAECVCSGDASNLLNFLVANIRSLSNSQFEIVVRALGVDQIVRSVTKRVQSSSSASSARDALAAILEGDRTPEQEQEQDRAERAVYRAQALQIRVDGEIECVNSLLTQGSYPMLKGFLTAFYSAYHE